MKPTTRLKDLRILAGRAEANITALKIGIETFEPKDPVMCERIARIAVLIRELRQQIEDLAHN